MTTMAKAFTRPLVVAMAHQLLPRSLAAAAAWAISCCETRQLVTPVRAPQHRVGQGLARLQRRWPPPPLQAVAALKTPQAVVPLHAGVAEAGGRAGLEEGEDQERRQRR